MNAICLVVDRLQIGCIGAYGNSWIETPAFDRLAAEGFTFDQAWVDGPHLEQAYRSFWHGLHPLEPDAAGWPALAEVVAGRGVRAVLMTDEPVVVRHAQRRGFCEILEMEPPARAWTAEDVGDTHLARCFARLIERLESPGEPILLWCHLQGMAAPWDAPMGFRRAYADADDPKPPDTAETPNRILPEDFDPDELLGLSLAYAGQMTLLDTCLGAFLEFLRDGPAGRDTLLAVVSPRGFPLGEHRRVGPCDDALYAELTHVPLVLRLPGGEGAAGRSAALVRPADLAATLADFFTPVETLPGSTARSLLPVVRGDAEGVRDRHAIVGRDHERAFLTPAWYLRAADEPELFVRRDDYWQVNDVAGRCPEVVDLLRAELARCEDALRSGRIADLPPLDERLVAEP